VHWATVYYPDAGDADEAAHPASGLLALVDPRQGGRAMPGLDVTGGTYTVLARTGRLVVFPGWLLHYVHAYRGRRPRVSISCNLVFEPAAAFTSDRHIGGLPAKDVRPELAATL
jgi:Putative 2OG-Fe(II) oxygenase